MELRRFEASDLDPAAAAEIYERDQLLWLRLPAEGRQHCHSFTKSYLQSLYAARPKFVAKHWSVESNPDQLPAACLEPASVLGQGQGQGDLEGKRYYVSSILQKDKSAQAEFLQGMPVAEYPLMAGATTDDGIWLFIGSNPSAAHGTGHGKKKRRREEERPALAGRPEHVDDVVHDGTWHVQVSGTKTW